jgi:hypothetical protein
LEKNFLFSELPNSSFSDPNGTNIFLLLSFILGALYLLGSNGDPVPEITWNTFYREMLTTGEVGSPFFINKTKGLAVCVHASGLKVEKKYGHVSNESYCKY